MIGKKLRAAGIAASCALAAPAAAELVGIEVETRADVAGGAAYGSAGSYEQLRGTLRFAVDPKSAANARVTDIALAPTNDSGRVELAADFQLLKPKDVARGNGALLLEVPNRGRSSGVFRMLDAPGTAAPDDVGDGFLLEQGFTVLWIGWQHDPPPGDALLRLHPPTTDASHGITGLVRSDFVVRTAGVRDQSLADREHVAYPAVNARGAVLTVRDALLGPRHTVPAGEWQFARVAGDGSVVPDPTRVYLARGFEPKRIYEVVYTAADPPLAGLGLVAIRDAVSHLKHDGARELGIGAGTFDRALGFGLSQSGRVLRTFLYEGFNEDERHRRVFDGVLAHIAGGSRGGFNARFAQPSRTGALVPSQLPPFTDAVQTDAVSGLRAGLLMRLDAQFVPKIFYTNSSNEYWRGTAALTHVTVDGRSDLAPPATTRIYFFAGTQHVPAAFPPRVGAGRLADNPHAYAWFLRALLPSLDAWVARDAAPPPSVYPTLAQKSLVDRSRLEFPRIPGVDVPAEVMGVLRLDFGPKFSSEGIATIEPPLVGAPYPVLLPQVDGDGNELAGLRSPELQVPLATHMGWQLYRSALGRDDELVSLQGSFAPFPRDAAERERTGDPRRAILERYESRERYLELVEQAAAPLIDMGYLRAADLPLIAAQAAERWRVLVEERR